MFPLDLASDFTDETGDSLTRTCFLLPLRVLDILGWDACRMAALGVFNAVFPYAKYFLASEVCRGRAVNSCCDSVVSMWVANQENFTG